MGRPGGGMQQGKGAISTDLEDVGRAAPCGTHQPHALPLLPLLLLLWLRLPLKPLRG